VGIDGSDNSLRALDWAIQEAHTQGARLIVVHAWSQPALAHTSVPLTPIAEEALERAARVTAERAVRDARIDHSGVDVELRVERGNPGEVLVRESNDGDLLVVGSRGRGPITGLLFGSTSQFVLRHASIPVVIVPQPVASEAAAA
jgi:nucleotide-binding universal stress UspA family protein